MITRFPSHFLLICSIRLTDNNIKKVIEATIREKKFDVLVVDDSSPDGTATIVKEIIKS